MNTMLCPTTQAVSDCIIDCLHEAGPTSRATLRKLCKLNGHPVEWAFDEALADLLREGSIRLLTDGSVDEYDII